MLNPTAKNEVKLRLPHRRGNYSMPVDRLMAAYSKVKTVKLRAKKAKTQGKRTKLGITRFLFQVFQHNELLPRQDKLTNEQIAAMLLEEFPDQDKLHRGLERGGKFGVNDYRRRYNSGTLVRDVFPDRCSFRYNVSGLPVDARTGRRVLSVTEQVKIAADYKSKFQRSGRARRTLESLDA
jgi:hypothetical protein